MCVLQSFENEGRYYECDVLPFMEVGSVAHKYYLLNIRLPVNERKKVNVGIGEIKDIRLVVSAAFKEISHWVFCTTNQIIANNIVFVFFLH